MLGSELIRGTKPGLIYSLEDIRPGKMTVRCKLNSFEINCCCFLNTY
jgi:hypothetical protein